LTSTVLDDFKKRYGDARGAIDAWVCEVVDAMWQTPQDIKARYRSADFLSDNRVIFNIKGNNYRLLVKVRYQGEIVVVEWIGTHAEYSKLRLK
jgi:mRNA interferase HigB